LSHPGLPWTILAFLLAIGPLVFVHEMGHYLVGRWFGVKAEVFSIGFGRELFGWTDRRGTRWKVGPLPLGGYVKFAGDMNPASQPSREWLTMPAEERRQTFQARPVWQRFLIVAAGPVTNFLFAILVFAALFKIYGEPFTPPVLGAVQSGSAAAEAGLRPGDRLVSVAGTLLNRYEDIQPLVVLRPGQKLHIEGVRQGKAFATDATIKAVEVKDRFGNHGRIGMLGVVSGAAVYRPIPLIEAPRAAVEECWLRVKISLQGLGQIITGARSVKELGGPLQIAKLSGEQATLGWVNFLVFVAVISINLGFINLLPVPMLDGGHLLFYAIEGVRRRPLPPRAVEWAFRTGLAALLVLMIFVTLNDLASFGLWSKLGGLIGRS
jgi:regulator of sigma E protease